MKAKTINIERVRELLEYRDGKLYWLVKVSNSVQTGKEAGYLNPSGYRYIKIDGLGYLAHRLIYVIVHGADPGDKQIDHRDGNKLNNNVNNLRLATPSENMRHRFWLETNSTSGCRGVSWHKRHNKWRVQVRVNGRAIHGGMFTNIADANARASAMRIEHYGEFQGVAHVIP